MTKSKYQIKLKAQIDNEKEDLMCKFVIYLYDAIG